MKRGANKCNSCGKFKPWHKLKDEQAESDEFWFVCSDCFPSKEPSE
jgi:hypothetical protein